MNEAVEEGGVKEERRSGRRYKEGDFGDFKGGWSGEKFGENNREEEGRNFFYRRTKGMEQRGRIARGGD